MHSHTCKYCMDTETETCKLSQATCVSFAQCSVCKKSFDKLDPSNHIGKTEIRGAVSATCQKAGSTGDVYCTSCDAIIERGRETAKSAHVYGQWTYAPQNGTDMHGRRCQNCTDMQTEACEKSKATCVSLAQCGVCKQTFGTVDPSSHVGGTAIRGAVAPTYQSAGYSGDTYCLSCNQTVSKGQEIAFLEHVFTQYKEIPASCTENAYRVYTCDTVGCNETKTVEMPDTALGHRYGTNTINATCLKDGVVTYKCKRCDLTMQEKLKALGHDYTVWSYLGEGVHISVCGREDCDASRVVSCTESTGCILPDGQNGTLMNVCTLCGDNDGGIGFEIVPDAHDEAIDETTAPEGKLLAHAGTREDGSVLMILTFENDGQVEWPKGAHKVYLPAEDWAEKEFLFIEADGRQTKLETTLERATFEDVEREYVTFTITAEDEAMFRALLVK